MVAGGRALFLLAMRARRARRRWSRHLAFLVALRLVAIGAFYLLYLYTVREIAVDRSELEWAPPVLKNPTTKHFTSTGYTETKLDTAKDYTSKLSSQQKVGATFIDGGHNVVIKVGTSPCRATTRRG
jgi:hypothetical protein